jgi:hypothetical protein
VCAAHIHNLIIRSSLDSNDKIKALIAKCRLIVGHFKRSMVAIGILREIQLDEDLPDHSLLQVFQLEYNIKYK